MSDFKPCPVCQEQSDQCLSCASYVVDGERIYYEKLKDFGATKDHEIRFINRIQKHRVTAFFHNGKLYIPSRQGRSVPLAIGLQWDAWQEQQAIIDNLKAQLNNMEACYIEKKKQVEAVDAVLMNWRDEYTEYTHQHECTVDSVLRTCITELEQALRGEHE
ncbi:hypothetical protein [Acinetobacter towneri]|uniref:hypothetical protein n=1 Tax=Acinetobacter towneri TaxID=202956 RepID=UPI00293623BF|nr:hypothetical protein [Acinetobacter towneri]MDV2454035.1 hypothetical protein [Acinetobacter towneri]